MTKKEKPLTPEMAAIEFVEMKAAKARIEKRIEELDSILKPFLENQPEQAAELNGWRFKLVHSERENFSLARAREKIDGRTLAPFISKSESCFIKTTWKGGAELEAA